MSVGADRQSFVLLFAFVALRQKKWTHMFDQQLQQDKAAGRCRQRRLGSTSLALPWLGMSFHLTVKNSFGYHFVNLF